MVDIFKVMSLVVPITYSNSKPMILSWEKKLKKLFVWRGFLTYVELIFFEAIISL